MMRNNEPRLLDLRLLPFAGMCWAATLIGILGGSRAAWVLVAILSGAAVLLAAG
ncbi:ComEC operon protein, partial [Rhodococcus wratislaviensis IFP 2016]